MIDVRTMVKEREKKKMVVSLLIRGMIRGSTTGSMEIGRSSFRGEDTRDGFTDHLYTALSQAGIHTFRDDTIERGKLLMPELKKAIHESAISLIVFSKSYSSSKWCLDEVMMIIEQHETSSSKHQFVPVFYKVVPSDVQNQTGSFRDSFDVYDDEINAETNLVKKKKLMEKVEAWKDSLNKAAIFTGLAYKDGYESNFIIDIVNVIRKKLDYKSVYIEEKLVGIEDNVAKIELWLQDSSPNTVVLLIDGMGGIGKSTIARCIYNSNSCNYDGSCFLANINKTSNQIDGLLNLQRQLLSMVLKSGKEECIWNVQEGINKVTRAISNKKVLLILDDVATFEQLDALLGPKRFYPGSKVIITTRHKELSTAFIVHPEVYSVEVLSTTNAIELFSLYAFRQPQPTEPYISQSQVIIDHCKGLPLALKVLGSSLREKTINEWKDTIRRLEETLDPEIQEVLEISYKSLKHETDKELFLHIACFFEGEKEDYIVKLLAQCDLYPIVGIKYLIDRCLLYVEDGQVMMHQLVKEMGRKIVRQESEKEPGKRSRLWHHQDCISVLQDQSGTTKVEGFMIDMQRMEEAKSTSFSLELYLGKRVHVNDADFKISALENMKNLLLLQLNYVKFSGKWKKFPKKLRLLTWHGCTLNVIPSEIYLEKLVVLDMSHSKLKRVWDDFKYIASLKILNLSHSKDLIKTPNFGGLPSLESLILKACSSLIKVDKSIAYLKELVLLDITDCTNLREFPLFPISLVSIHMSGCGAVGQIHSLDPVPSLSALVEMDISNCNLLENSFPNDWSSLVSLAELNISGNKVITSLPKCIQTLPRVQSLTVANCSNIQSISLPKSVMTLIVSCNASLETIHHNRLSTMVDGKCPKLCEIKGRRKVKSIHQIERQIIRRMGLESNAGEGMELGLEVLHEFGIFSMCVSGIRIPSGFMYKQRGSQISFDIPCPDDKLRISGFSMFLLLSRSSGPDFFSLKIDVYNKTKDILFTYHTEPHEIRTKEVENYAWLSIWRCGDLLEGGDEIVISIMEYEGLSLRHDVEECCINLIYMYEDDEH
ncbi:hypothetical protein LXL04_016495 [Taraxacum kok-saghyz]